jgi:hypothetical protein
MLPNLTSDYANTHRRVKVTVNELAPREVRRKRSNTMPSETPSPPSRRKRRSLPLNSEKPRRTVWQGGRGERKSLQMKSYKLSSYKTDFRLWFSLFFSSLLYAYNVGTDWFG